MSTSVQKAPTSAATIANGGTVDWVNPSYAVMQNSGYWAKATQSLSTSVTSYLLGVYGCGFAIPTGATINGIIATLHAHMGGILGGANLVNAYLRKASGSYGATNVSAGISITVTDSSNPQTVTLGSSTNLWGETLTATDINNSNFGFGVQFNALSKSFVAINWALLTVYYTEAASGPAYVKTVNGLAKASVKSVNGLLIASVKSIDGLA